MKNMLFVVGAIVTLTAFLFAQESTRNITLQWDAPAQNSGHGTFIYATNAYSTNYSSFGRIMTVMGSTNTTHTISNLPYGVYSMYCTTFATNQTTTNVLESVPSNILFFRHSPAVISD